MKEKTSSEDEGNLSEVKSAWTSAETKVGVDRRVVRDSALRLKCKKVYYVNVHVMHH